VCICVCEFVCVLIVNYSTSGSFSCFTTMAQPRRRVPRYVFAREGRSMCCASVCVGECAHTCARTCACAPMRKFANVALQPSFVFKSVYAFLHTHTYRCCPPTSYILTQSSTHTLFFSLTHTRFLFFFLSFSVAHTHTHTHR